MRTGTLRLLRHRPSSLPNLVHPLRLNIRMNHSAAPPPSSGNSSKRIFAPTSDPTSQQAEQYTLSSLSSSDLSTDPIAQFHSWFLSAQTAQVHQPETVCLSTASLPSGTVSARYVYLKELDDRGFVIYSNTGHSRKSEDLKSNPHAALAFWWREVERQVRVEGKVEYLTREESQVYFDTRGRGSRIGAWASRQSHTLKDRGELDGWVQEIERKFEGEEKIPVPEYWGGIRVVPNVMEFWQGRNSRLHDRFRYTRLEGGVWKMERLSP